VVRDKWPRCMTEETFDSVQTVRPARSSAQPPQARESTDLFDETVTLFVKKVSKKKNEKNLN
jgi:hypothetical protein